MLCVKSELIFNTFPHFAWICNLIMCENYLRSVHRKRLRMDWLENHFTGTYKMCIWLFISIFFQGWVVPKNKGWATAHPWLPPKKKYAAERVCFRFLRWSSSYCPRLKLYFIFWIQIASEMCRLWMRVWSWRIVTSCYDLNSSSSSHSAIS